MKAIWAAVLAASASTGLAAQDVPSAGARQFDLAVRSLNARIDARPLDQPLPRTSDPAVAQMIATIADDGGVFGTPAFPVRGYASYEPVCGAARATAMRYAMFGVDRANAAAAAANGGVARENLVRTMSANTRAYQNEILPLMRFSVRCNALHIPVLEQALRQASVTPQQRDGLAKFRNGLVQLVEGTLQMAGQSAIQQSHRASVFRQISADVEPVARILTLAQRASLAARVARYAPIVPLTAKGDFDRLVASLGDRRCAGLCLIG